MSPEDLEIAGVTEATLCAFSRNGEDGALIVRGLPLWEPEPLRPERLREAYQLREMYLGMQGSGR